MDTAAEFLVTMAATKCFEDEEKWDEATTEFCDFLTQVSSETFNETEKEEEVEEDVSVLEDDVSDVNIALRTQHFFFIRYCLLILAVLITILVMLTQKRKKCCPRCCNGFFALVIPVNFLENKRNRLTYLSAFALISIDIFLMIGEKDELTKGINVFIKVFIRIGLVLFTSFLCLPLLICFSADTYVSLILGILYAMAYLAARIYEEVPVIPFSELNAEDKVEIFSNDIPLILFGICMLFGYFRRIYIKITRHDEEKAVTHAYQVKYIKQLLSPKCNLQESNLTEKNNKCVACMKKRMYNPTAGFRYSLSLLVSIIIGLIAITYFISNILTSLIELHIQLFDIFHLPEIRLTLRMITLPNLLERLVKLLFKNAAIDSKWTITAFDFIYDQFLALFGCIYAGIATVYVALIFTQLHMLRSYKESIQDLHQRKRAEHLLRIKTISNVRLVVSAVQYCGYQVAYFIWGAFLQCICFIIIYFILCEVIILPMKYAFWTLFLEILDKVYTFVVILLLTKGIQYLLVKFVFLQERGNLLALQNRKGFYSMMYFMFFYNFFMGIFSCVLRIIKAIVFGLWFLPRLDRSIFPRTFEHFDTGFKSYTCLLKLEAMQSNIIVVAFLNILLHKETKDGLEIEQDIENFTYEMSKSSLSKRRHVARNRWFIAYTLLRNPVLIEKRKPHLLLFSEQDPSQWESSV